MHLVCEPFIQLQNEKPVQIATSERAFLLCKTHNKKLCLAVATLERGETKRENEGAQEKLSTFFVRIQSQIPNKTRPESLVKYRKEK